MLKPRSFHLFGLIFPSRPFQFIRSFSPIEWIWIPCGIKGQYQHTTTYAHCTKHLEFNSFKNLQWHDFALLMQTQFFIPTGCKTKPRPFRILPWRCSLTCLIRRFGPCVAGWDISNNTNCVDNNINIQ